MPNPHSTATSTLTLRNFNLPQKIPAHQKSWQDFLKTPPAFAQEPFTASTAEIERFAQKKFSALLILGIGGSTLAPQTLIQALSPQKRPIYFLETPDSAQFHAVLQKVNLPTLGVVVISKSGQTLETLTQFLALLPKLQKTNLCLLAAPTDNFLAKFAAKNQLPFFALPPKIDGRFAACTPVGLLPAALAGLKITQILQGARAVAPQRAFQFARRQTALYRQNKSIAVLCSYSPKLAKFGEWWTQLLAESLGKIASNGKRVGLTPVNSLGPAAQHSSLQLWLAGPRDKFFLFLNVASAQSEVTLGDQLPPEFSFLSGKNFRAIRQAEFEATTQVLIQAQLPLTKITLSELTEYSLGQLFQFFLLTTYFLGKMLSVEPFGQPAVEAGKKLACAKLKAKK